MPREDGTPDWTAGPKIVHFDRVEWHVIPDAATRRRAMQSGEMDWWENPTADMLPVLALDKKLVTRVTRPHRADGLHAAQSALVAPFDNPAIRRAVLDAVDQADFMIAVAGNDPKMWHVPTGIFSPGTPMASDVGLAVFDGEARLRRAEEGDSRTPATRARRWWCWRRPISRA